MNLGPYTLNTIYTGDARELSKAIPDESVDLIFTDPVYDRIDDYRWLAETSERILRCGGSVVAQVGTHFRYDAETAMRGSGLNPCPLLSEVLNGGLQQNWKHRSIIGWKPYIWMSRGKPDVHWPIDRWGGGKQSKTYHGWGDDIGAFTEWIRRMSIPGAIVFDPFTGGGTVPAVCKMLGRHYLAFEIDPDTAETARERVRNTQPPLIVPQAEQIEIEFEHGN